MTLVAFDFDGTLSQSDLSVLLGREYDRGNEIRNIVEQGMRGEVEFATSLRQRISLLEGMPERQMERAFERAKLRKGAADLIADLRGSDVSVAILTGSFEQGVEAALDRAGVSVDWTVANQLVIENGALTGEVEGPLVDAGKDRALEELVLAEGVDAGQTIAVGNGSSDIPMLQSADTAIGYDPESIVEMHCDVVVTSIRKLQLYLEQSGVIDT